MSSGPSLLGAQVVVEQRLFWRNRSGVFFTFVFPLLLLAMFGSMGGDNEILVTGIAALVIVSTTFQGLAIALAFHRDQGVLKRIMATPLSPVMLVAGKVVSVALVALLEVAIVVAAGAAFFGMGLPGDPSWFLFGVMCGVLAFSSLGFALAALIPSGDSAPAITNAVYLPMMFISGVFYEVTRMPTALQYLATALPLTHLVDLLRDAWLGRAGDQLLDATSLIAWGVVGVAYSALRFRWEPAHET